jgi:hypothetical protein
MTGQGSQMDRVEHADFNALIERLNRTPLLSRTEETERYERRQNFLREAMVRMIENGETYGQASGDLAIYNQPEEFFREEIRNTDNDLNEQISRFNFGLDRWFEYGECHPPYFPWRIAVILSKRKDTEREQLFLAAYCRHFWNRKGTRDEAIVARAEKRGVFKRP